jgi:hypothetical protein
MKPNFPSCNLKGGIMRKNIGSFLIAGSLLGMIGMSMPAIAMADTSYQIVNATCQFGNDDAGSGLPLTDGAPGGTKQCGSAGGEVALVPKSGNKCFFLTDFSATNNNGSTIHGVRVIDGNTPGSTPYSLVYTVPAPSTIVQHFATPIVFSNASGLHVYEFGYVSSNDTVFVSVSGFYNRCPYYNTRP